MAEKKFKIATLGSHSALQILKGARDEGFETILVTNPKSRKVYESFGLADKIIQVKDYADYFSVEKQLIEENAILIPHGTFITALGAKENKKIKARYYGNKNILEVEADRSAQREWLQKAGLKVPKQFSDPKDIDRPTIVKYYGAEGGKGYFLARNNREFVDGMKKFGSRPAAIQEYIVGVPFYIHYFYSNLTNELEIMSMDRRYETNVDAIGRIPLKSQKLADISPSFVVVGNAPLVLRESMLSTAMEMGEKLVAQSRKVCPPKGLYGPFCIETIITPEQEFYVIEVSARIVAGTNLFINGSPYTHLRYCEPMSTGRRVAREIKTAIKQGRLDEIA